MGGILVGDKMIIYSQWKVSDTPLRYRLIEAVGPYEAFHILLREDAEPFSMEHSC